ncbi:MAG: preprotein translocase subunit SecE [Candidatus Glassbacteria bacterium RIFCSPLOWO2_12_FULL_58_11]|uniref:Protein translocase subunit SecE n=2 Tax=Candidatus Glassiibacteriota TaxID=1817805 RepID=A0A1F5Z293_9BACT|nr:MAG: preprotein translocase subunit SecE [Candidatus Glassbacteria bacterium GWA2_58_10]OGG06579.1 MAG: preprotein translocase subunit SecE [Candidatus Glassbacteria bacterium RIFCSPLOWO2_12_FULL_58_11]
MDRLVQFLKEVRNEVARVTWPTGNEVKGATVVVIVVCIIVAFVIWTVDKTINLGMNLIFK